MTPDEAVKILTRWAELAHPERCGLAGCGARERAEAIGVVVAELEQLRSARHQRAMKLMSTVAQAIAVVITGAAQYRAPAPSTQPAEPQECERGCDPDHRCRRCRLEDAARAGLLPAQEVKRDVP